MNLDVTTREGYNIASALRGPDNTDMPGMKALFTARLRGMVGVIKDGILIRHGSSLSDLSGFLIDGTEDWKGMIFRELDLMKDGKLREPHFFRHVRSAFESISILTDKTEIAAEARRLSDIADYISYCYWSDARDKIEAYIS